MYSGNYAGHRFSALDQINTRMRSLVPKRAYQTMAGGKFETTPLVVDGVLQRQDDRNVRWMQNRAAHLAIPARTAGGHQTVLDR
jgi:hypothetical protein